MLYLSEWFREQIAGFGGLKVQFIQDEYRRVDAMTAQMRELGIDVLYQLCPGGRRADVYGSRLPGVDILPTLTGYVPAGLDERPGRRSPAARWTSSTGAGRSRTGSADSARTRP